MEYTYIYVVTKNGMVEKIHGWDMKHCQEVLNRLFYDHDYFAIFRSPIKWTTLLDIRKQIKEAEEKDRQGEFNGAK